MGSGEMSRGPQRPLASTEALKSGGGGGRHQPCQPTCKVLSWADPSLGISCGLLGRSFSPASLPSSLTSPTVASCLPSGAQPRAWRVSAGQSLPGPAGPLPRCPCRFSLSSCPLILPLGSSSCPALHRFFSILVFSAVSSCSPTPVPAVTPWPPLPSEVCLSNSPGFF